MENVLCSLCNQLLSSFCFVLFLSSNSSYFEISLITLLLAHICLGHFKVFYAMYVLHTQCVIFLNLSSIIFLSSALPVS